MLDLPALEAAQRELELETLRSAKERYDELQAKAREAGAIERLTGYDRLMLAALPGVTKVLEEWVADTTAAKGKAPQALLPIRTLGAEACAYLGILVALEHVHVRKNCRDAFCAIGAQVQEELWVSELQAEDPKVWSRLFSRIVEDTKGDPRKTLRRTRRLAGQVSEKVWRKWEATKLARVGEPILNAVLMGSGLVEVITIGQERALRLTQDAAGWLRDRQAGMAYQRPSLLPMVCPPRPWGHGLPGPFVTRALNSKVSLMRVRNAKARKGLKVAIADGSAQRVVDALNIIGQTEWRINKPVMEAVQWVFQQGYEPTEGMFTGLSSFPRSTLIDVPDLPPDDGTEDLEYRRAKAARHAIITAHREAETEALGFMKDMAAAEQMAGYDRFWIPHNIDFRGRIYPLPHLNQQRTDYVKGMLEFAEGKALGHQGAYWLAVHLANCGDFDKISKRPIKDRYNWTRDNRHTIKEIANDYKSNLTWLEADKPFQFLAACIEYAAFMDCGPLYRSRCAVALDGTNSGLQHYSAALRAEHDAYYVNLRDVAEGQDIYRAVAERCLSLMEAQLKAGGLPEDQQHLAKLWLAYGVSRTIVKRPVMTFPYAAETFGFAEQIIEDTIKPLSREVREGRRSAHPFGDPATGYRAASFLAKILWQAVNDTVSRAGEGMAYFKAVASTLAAEGHPVEWVTPVGLPVCQEYQEWEVRKAVLKLYVPKKGTCAPEVTLEELADPWVAVEHRLQIKPSGKIKRSKQRSAIAPNVIHSLDASHMMLTVLKAEQEGIRSFSLIHDSFATHAADTDHFFLIIREEFAAMYAAYDIFEVIDEQARSVLNSKGAAKLPEVPAKGILDLTEVTRSQFAFS